MKNLLSPLWAKADLNLYLVLSSAFIHTLGLSSAIFIMLIYQRYLSHGLDGTLYTLSSGAFLAVMVEMVLRRARYNIIASLCVIEARKLTESVRHTLLNAHSGALQLALQKADEGTTSWIEKTGQAISPSVVMAVLDFPFALLFLAVLFALSWQLGLVALIATLILLLLLSVGAYNMKALTAKQQAVQGSTNSLLKNTELTETVRINNAQDWLTTRLDIETAESRVAKHSTQQQQEKMQSHVRSATMILSVLVISVGASLSIHGELDFGMLIAANILAGRLVALVSQPIQQLPLWLNAIQAHAKLVEFSQLPEETQGGTQLPHYQGKLRFNNVAFTYPNAPLAIYERLNFDVNAGELLLVVGNNGQGKTTLARLITGLLVPDRGSITVDNVELRQVNAHWWREQLVYLPQDPDLLPGSLRDNLCFIKPDTDDAALLVMLHKVGLGPWIEQHPEGLALQIQVRGRNLSLGIRRRIALARALLTQGQLIVIDEPLEGLDQAGITMMQQVLAELASQQRTVVIISQFMQAVDSGTKVVNLDGRHDMQITSTGSREPTLTITQGAAVI